jgi:hypothetical protein
VGGVICGVLTSEEKAFEYFQLMMNALDSEKETPNWLMTKVNMPGEMVTNDIGDKGVFSHRIYHFELDPTVFRATKVVFASDWIESYLGEVRLKMLRTKYEQDISGKYFWHQ